MCPLEGVGHCVVAGALVHVQHLDVHGHRNRAPKHHMLLLFTMHSWLKTDRIDIFLWQNATAFYVLQLFETYAKPLDFLKTKRP